MGTYGPIEYEVPIKVCEIIISMALQLEMWILIIMIEYRPKASAKIPQVSLTMLSMIFIKF